MNAHVPALVAEVFRAVAHRRLLDRLRLSASCRSTAAAPTEDMAPCRRPATTPQSCVGRERMFEYFSAQARHAGPPGPAQLRDRHALRRAARRRRQGAARRADRRRHGPRQRHLAGRRQRRRAALPGARHDADDADQRHRPGDDRVRWLAEEFGRRFGRAAELTGSEAPPAGSTMPRAWSRSSARRASASTA